MYLPSVFILHSLVHKLEISAVLEHRQDDLELPGNNLKFPIDPRVHVLENPRGEEVMQSGIEPMTLAYTVDLKRKFTPVPV